MYNHDTNVTNLSTQISNLTTRAETVSAIALMIAPASSSHRDDVVKRPDTYDGEEMDASWVYQTNWQVWLMDNVKRIAECDENNIMKRTEDGKVVTQGQKQMASFMSFLTGKVANWARPHMEKLAQGQTLFDNNWEVELEKYKANFEPLNEEQKARAKIRQIRQGSQSFARYKVEFEQYSGRTGWDDVGLMDYLHLSLNDEYSTCISYYEKCATTYAELVSQCQKAEAQIRNLQGDKAAKRGELPATCPRHLGHSETTVRPLPSPLHP